MPRGVVQRKRGKGKEKEAEEKKGRIGSIKNRIRSIHRLLRKELPAEVKIVQEKKLEELQALADEHAKGELERMMTLRYRKVKFIERRKVERRIRRVERQLRGLTEIGGDDRGAQQATELAQNLSELKEDLEYIQFFPKAERYVSLFMGNDDEEVIKKRRELRLKIKDNLAAAAAAGHDLEETGSEDDGALDMSEDDFFMGGSSSDDADADDELGDDTSREQILPSPKGDISSSPIKKQRATENGHHRHRTAGVSHGNLRNGHSRPTGQGSHRPINIQKGQAARDLMPPPRARNQQGSSSSGGRLDSDGPRGASSSKGTVESSSGDLSNPRRKRTRPKKRR